MRHKQDEEVEKHKSDSGNESKSIRIKILSLGSAKCGKTCIIKRYCESRFISKYVPTIGVDFGVKSFQIKSGRGSLREKKSTLHNSQPKLVDVKVNFFDLSGRPEFFEIRNEFYKDASGAFLVFDVSDKKSFHELKDWLVEIKTGVKCNSMINIPVLLCGNKVDKPRVITEKDAVQFAAENGLVYFETSCKTGADIDDMLEFLFRSTVKCL